MPYPTQTEARAFFDQLSKFSARLIRRELADTPTASSNVGKWRAGKPQGAILHYTASASWTSPVGWFCGFREAAAHVVVCDRQEPRAQGLCDDLPLVKALPVTVVQCVPPTLSAWHARWANGLCYGVENRNNGLVKRDNPRSPWRSWPKAKGSAAEWSALATPIPGKAYKATSPTEGFEAYTRAQVQTNVVILRYVGALGGEPLEPALVLPHSAIQAAKWDTGPLFPIHEVRRLACINVDEDVSKAFEDLDDPSPDKLTSTDDLDGGHMAFSLLASEDRKTLDDERQQLEKSIEALRRVADGPGEVSGIAVGVRAKLDRLGFFVPTPRKPDMVDPWLQRALWAFQTGAGVRASNAPDPNTVKAIDARLAQLASP